MNNWTLLILTILGIAGGVYLDKYYPLEVIVGNITRMIS